MNRKFNGASWDSIFLTIVKVITIVTSILFTKILSVGLSLESYGSYSQVNIVITIGTSILMFGLGDGLNYYFNRKNSNIKDEVKFKFVNTIFFLELFLGALFVVGVTIFRDYIANYFSNGKIAILLIIASVKPAIDNLLYFYQILYISHKKAKIISIRNLVVSILKLIAIFIVIRLTKNLIIIFSVLIVMDVLQYLFFALYYLRISKSPNPFRMDFKLIPEILKYCLPMGVFLLTSTFTREVDKLVIGHFESAEVLAVYNNCSKILPFDIVATSFATVLMPLIMKYHTEGNSNKTSLLFKSYLKIGYYTVWILGFGALIASKQIISFLYSDEYVVGNNIFVVYTIVSMINFASMHLIITAAKKGHLLMFYSLGALCLNIVLNLLFYKMFGIIGPAISTLLISLLFAFAVLLTSKRIISAQWKQLFDFNSLFLFVFEIFAPFILFYKINDYLITQSINKYLSMILCCVSFGGICVALNWKDIISTLKIINQL